jgi:hypothetical protein
VRNAVHCEIYLAKRRFHLALFGVESKSQCERAARAVFTADLFDDPHN